MSSLNKRRRYVASAFGGDENTFIGAITIDGDLFVEGDIVAADVIGDVMFADQVDTGEIVFEQSSAEPTEEHGLLYLDNGTNTVTGDASLRQAIGPSNAYRDVMYHGDVIATPPVDVTGSLAPSIGGTPIAGATITAHYIRIGQLVNFFFAFLWSGDTSADTGVLTIQLPFQSLTYQSPAITVTYQRIALDSTYELVGLTNTSGTHATFQQYGPGQRETLKGTNTVASGQKYIFGQMTYMAAA